MDLDFGTYALNKKTWFQNATQSCPERSISNHTAIFYTSMKDYKSTALGVHEIKVNLSFWDLHEIPWSEGFRK